MGRNLDISSSASIPQRRDRRQTYDGVPTNLLVLVPIYYCVAVIVMSRPSFFARSRPRHWFLAKRTAVSAAAATGTILRTNQ